MSLIHLNFESQYLNSNTDVNIIMPDKPRDADARDFYVPGEKYKVLWLLHGTFGDYSDWIRKSKIELYACEKNLIVVMPSALNSNYSNWGCMMGYNMFDFVIKELMPLVHSWLPASSKREDNFICGLSMGGEGALKYAVNYPEKFAGVSVLSMFARDWENMDPAKTKVNARDLNSYANAGGHDRFINSYENIRKLILDKKESGSLPRMLFYCGEEDFLFEGYKEFKNWLIENDVPAQFCEIPGYTHEWRFWDIAVEKTINEFIPEQTDDAGNPF